MALTPLERRKIRNSVERTTNAKGVQQTWTKPQIDAAVEAIEARWDATSTQNAIRSDIEAAAPGVFTRGQKKHLVAFWLILRGGRERGAL